MALAKIRAVHPDLFSDEDLAEISIEARFFFIGMWCFACDNGHLENRPKQLKLRILPTDKASAADLIRELASVAVIDVTDDWITIPGLPKRQKLDWRYFKTCDRDGCERPRKKDAELADPEPETRREPSETRRGPGGTTRGPATDGDGDGDGDVTTPSVLSAATSAAKPKRATQRPADFRPSQAHIDLAASLDVDLRAEWQQFCDHHDAKGSTFKDWPAALRTWIRNAAKFGRRTSVASTPRQQADADMFARQMARAEAREAAARGEIA